MTNEQYHSDTSRISKSGLDLISVAPAKYWDRYLNPEKSDRNSTPEMIFGDAYHCAILRPDDFKNEFIILPEFRGEGSMKRKDEFIQMHPDQKTMSLSDYDTALKMGKAARSHPFVKKILSKGEPEKVVTWVDPMTEAKCKARFDWLTPDGIIFDPKTTKDASPAKFWRSALEYRYDVQGPFYKDGANESGLDVNTFVFMAQEKTSPYLVKLYWMDERSMNLGRKKYRLDLETYTECKKTGVWPGYESEIISLEFPEIEYEKFSI